ncbi:RnfABCDGE type electron transport complex subunit D [Clostridium merdae]|uniref:RnfABCDGE type electron transport complex subunit D n=1 Tax=Clostridium merdae TaxID=1958780 RepID=UPI000A26CD49|nr:RnfABCDGE type electron transport complex subunit D [Clostridium merdae]
MQQLIIQKPPFLRSGQTVSSMIKDMLLALALLLALPTVHYGLQVLLIAFVSMASCFICEVAACMVAKRQVNISELSFVVTGLIIAMLMPPYAPLWLPMAAAAFAVLVARVPFGFTGNNPFNPAAAGVAFVTVFWPQKVFSYLEPSASSVLKEGLKPFQVPSEMLWGNASGAIGTTAVLVIAACAVYLIVKKTVNWRITVCFLAAAGLMALLFPRIMVTPLTSLKYEMLSGSLLFCAVFLITDPVTSPRTQVGKAIYGAVAGVLIMLMRRYGAFEQAACFAVLLMNAISPVIDSFVIAILTRREARRSEQQ